MKSKGAATALVTGGAGFIGSHTVDLLLQKGYDVRILDNLQPRVHPRGKPPWLAKNAEFMQGDAANPKDLSRALHGVRYVFHLAAYQDYMTDFSNFIHTNTESSSLLFEIIVSDPKRYPVQKIVFASSQSVCGEGPHLCPRCAGNIQAPSIQEQLLDPARAHPPPSKHIFVPDSRPLKQLQKAQWEILCPACGHATVPLLIDETVAKPGTAYAISKYAIEWLALQLGKRYDIPTACMRYTYVQGPRNSIYNAYSGIARRFAMRLLHNLPPTVYEDGKQLRDYVNVSDVARANVLVLEDERADYEVFNVGGNRAVTVLEFANIMLKEFGSGLEPLIQGEYRIGDTRHTISDTSKLRRLGWAPRIPVEQNVEEYVQWIKAQENTQEYLQLAERFMREQKVLQTANQGNC